jgi:retinol-binding protein 3
MNTIRQRLATLLCLAVCAIAFNQRLYGQAASANQPVVVDGPLRQKLVDNIIRELHAKYVAPEKVKGIETHLRTKLQSGAYDKSTTPNQFASALTTDLRTASKDLHLFVTYDPGLEAQLIAAPATPSFELQELPPTAEQLTRLREANYNFRKLEIMTGNVGYLDLRTFVDLNLSKDTAVAAMNFLANTDAVIIDLRHNPGGFINLEIFLISYFYGFDPVELLSRYHREGEVTIRDWTLREVPGKRLQHTALYVLTSRETGSAGEGFSFILQQRRRARIIGEKTSGAGYGNKETPIGNGFVFYVSTFRQFDPRTGRGWQEVGVEPDIAVPAERALSVAHLEAVKNLATQSADALRKQRLSWLASILQLEAHGAKDLPASLLDSYAGKYDGGKIVVTLEQGQLYFLGASGVKRKLHALTDDTFLIEDASVPRENQAQVRFVKNAAGSVTELQLLVADGRAFPRAKDRQ